jgi:sec-independent protein translocase protein TatB
MFEVGFTEIILIAGLALIVLGPERLPGLAAQIGRWVGRARAMARQLRDQLDQEVNLKQEPWRQRPSTPATPEPDDDSLYYPEGRSHHDAGEDPVESPPASAQAADSGAAEAAARQASSSGPDSAASDPPRESSADAHAPPPDPSSPKTP